MKSNWMELGIQLSGGALALHERGPRLDEWKEGRIGKEEGKRKKGRQVRRKGGEGRRRGKKRKKVVGESGKKVRS